MLTTLAITNPMSRMSRKPSRFGRNPKIPSVACWKLLPMSMGVRPICDVKGDLTDTLRHNLSP